MNDFALGAIVGSVVTILSAFIVIKIAEWKMSKRVKKIVAKLR